MENCFKKQKTGEKNSYTKVFEDDIITLFFYQDSQ